MNTYYEYAEWIVDAGKQPATLCYEKRENLDIFIRKGSFQKIADADRVYSVTGNTLVEHKNRNGLPSTKFISDEDSIILRLKAVPIK